MTNNKEATIFVQILITMVILFFAINLGKLVDLGFYFGKLFSNTK